MDLVEKQYQEYVYPLPVKSLENENGRLVIEGSDPAYYRRKFWPKNIEPDALNILIAGCGSNQAARIAFNNPESMVIGVDISDSSLAHQEYLKKKYNLKNLTLMKMRVEDVSTLDINFDLIISTGVLHHLKDPDLGLQSLKKKLNPCGVMSIMLYSLYGRAGVYMLQEAFRILGLNQNQKDIQLVKDTLDIIPSTHHIKSFLTGITDLSYDAGIVDLFLHPQDRAYTVNDVLTYASKNGLKFQGWLDNYLYSIETIIPRDHPLYPRVILLPKEDQWKIVELLTHQQIMHCFLLCHPEKPNGNFELDFNGIEPDSPWLKYKPSIRRPFEIIQKADKPGGKNTIIKRGKLTFELSFNKAKVFEKCNGERSIHEIIQSLIDNNNDYEKLTKFAQVFFSRMAELDNLIFEIQ